MSACEESSKTLSCFFWMGMHLCVIGRVLSRTRLGDDSRGGSGSLNTLDRERERDKETQRHTEEKHWRRVK